MFFAAFILHSNLYCVDISTYFHELGFFFLCEYRACIYWVYISFFHLFFCLCGWPACILLFMSLACIFLFGLCVYLAYIACIYMMALHICIWLMWLFWMCYFCLCYCLAFISLACVCPVYIISAYAIVQSYFCLF